MTPGGELTRRGFEQASANFARYLEQLHAEAGDPYDPKTLVRNGPGSSNYRNRAGKPQINEISPGSAFLYAGYRRAGFDNARLERALTQAAPVLKDVGPYPSTLFTKVPIPPITGEEYFLKGSSSPDQAGDGIDYFGAIHAVRAGRVVDVWPTFTRWGTVRAR